MIGPYTVYPNPIPCSGEVSIGEIRNWMIAAGEIPSVTTCSLEYLVTNSHLADKTRPHSLSQFLCYAVVAPTYYTYIVRPSNNLGTICTDPTVTVYSSSILLTAGDFIFYDTALTNPVTGYDYVVRASGSPNIYYMNPGTGELTSYTGIDC